MSGLERLAEMMENPVGDDDTDRARKVAEGIHVKQGLYCCYW